VERGEFHELTRAAAGAADRAQSAALRVVESDLLRTAVGHGEDTVREGYEMRRLEEGFGTVGAPDLHGGNGIDRPVELAWEAGISRKVVTTRTAVSLKEPVSLWGDDHFRRCGYLPDGDDLRASRIPDDVGYGLVHGAAACRGDASDCE
jgi:hypothetical protein